MVHAALNYSLTLSAGRVQQANTPGVTMTLNITNTMSGQILGFSWNVTDPSGSVSAFFSAAAANGPVLTLNAVYPRDFSGASIKYNGTYRVNIFLTYPSPTALVATGRFNAGLTDSLTYQRTAQASILAQGYTANENITIRISHSGIPAPGFPRSQLANNNGIFSYLWPIPVSTPLGAFNVSLYGQTTIKRPPDSQIFTVLPTGVSISQLTANVTALQGSQIAVFTFSGAYPDGSLAKTGNGTIRVIEPDGVTFHFVNAPYNTTISAFKATYQVASGRSSGGWIAIIDTNAFSDGYGDLGPATSVARGFVVEPAPSQSPQTSTTTYELLVVVAILASVLTFLVSWIFFFGREKVRRNVLKVDFESIEREAARVENREFFGKIQDQLKQRQPSSSNEEKKDG